MSRIWKFRIAGLLIAVLIVAVVAARYSKDDRVASPSRTTITLGSSHHPPRKTTTTVPEAVQRQSDLDELQAFVEKTRGLKFKTKPVITLLANTEFDSKVNELQHADAQDLTTSEVSLRALGLMNTDSTLSAQIDELLKGAVLGVYDPKSKQLYVRAGELTPATKSTIVHEMTHALQDQYFGLDRKLDDDVNEASSAFTAVVEGEAVFVQHKYEAQLSRQDQRDILREQISQGQDAYAGAAPFLVDSLTFPYLDGPNFVEQIVAKKGIAGMDGVFAKPPITTEQIIHPEKYLSGELNVAVPKPAPGPAVLEDGVLGEAFFDEMLTTRISAISAKRAAAGWGGDSYSAYKMNDSDCVTARIVMDSPKDEAEMVAALRSWAGAAAGVSLGESNGGIDFTSCTIVSQNV